MLIQKNGLKLGLDMIAFGVAVIYFVAGVIGLVIAAYAAMFVTLILLRLIGLLFCGVISAPILLAVEAKIGAVGLIAQWRHVADGLQYAIHIKSLRSVLYLILHFLYATGLTLGFVVLPVLILFVIASGQ